MAEKSESAPPETGEGSEYGRQWREEARRRKKGYANRKSEPDDNPWVLKEKKKGGKQLSYTDREGGREERMEGGREGGREKEG